MKYIKKITYIATFITSIIACNNTTEPKKPLSKDEQLVANIKRLKDTAAAGDLIVRLNDDLISEQVKMMSEQDKSYSHAGIVVEKDGAKYVCHIMPEIAGADTIQLTPIDTFINPAKNISCALYRYKITKPQKDSLQQILLNNKKTIKFDRVYDLATDSVMYCSEMISKALATATHGQIQCKTIKVPTPMKPLLRKYFSQYKNADKIVDERTFLSIDNLYLRPDCELLMKFPLKIFQGN